MNESMMALLVVIFLFVSYSFLTSIASMNLFERVYYGFLFGIAIIIISTRY